MNDEEFAALVDREINGVASQEDQDYLWSSVDVVRRFRTQLVEKNKNAKSKIASLKLQLEGVQYHELPMIERDAMSKREWHAYKAEQENKIIRTKAFMMHIDHRLSTINEWLRQQTSSGYISDPMLAQNVAHTLRSGYSTGWRDAINHMKFLMEKGLTLQAAYEICSAYHKKKLLDWKKAEDPRQQKPRLPLPRDGWGMPLKEWRAYDNDLLVGEPLLSEIGDDA